MVISHPRAYANPLAAVTGGITAHNAALEKEDLYYTNFVIPAGHMVPLSAETGGRLHDSFRKFLKETITSGLDFGGSPEPIWTKETRLLYSSRMRSALVTISIAIAREVANLLIYGSSIIARYAVR